MFQKVMRIPVFITKLKVISNPVLRTPGYIWYPHPQLGRASLMLISSPYTGAFFEVN